MKKKVDIQEVVCILQGEHTQREKENASQILVARFNKSLLYFALKKVRQKEEAEDIVQQVWTKVFTNIGNYQPTNSFSTWLFKVANNQLIDANRKRRLNVVSLDNSLPNDENDEQYRSHDLMIAMADDSLNPEETMEFDERKDMVHELLNLLNPNLRKIVLMRYMEELSYEEIAERIDKPIGTVKTALFRAKGKLDAFAMDLKLKERY
jgi:RNA polymerase sigma-70 factor (ECF subfamily)